MQSKIGVLFQDDMQDYHILANGKIVWSCGGFNIMKLHKEMAENDVERVWVYPDTVFSRIVEREMFTRLPNEYDWYTPRKMDYDGQPSTLRIHRRGDSDRYIIFPQHQECAIPAPGLKGQWELPDPQTLYTTVSYLEQEYDIPILWSGGKIGEELLRRSHLHIKKPIQPLPTGLGYQWDVVQRNSMDRLVWKTYMLDALLLMFVSGEIHVVGVDKNGQYLGASNGAILGNGGFIPSSHFIPKSAGFWQYKIKSIANTDFNGKLLPCPLDVKRHYASTALIEAAHEVGVDFDIIEGIVWPEKGRYLKDWTKECWKHRIAFRNGVSYPDEIAARNAERSAKLYPNSMVGRFMNDYSEEYFHPDWQIGIIHQAIANQVYTLARLNRVFGIVPILVNKDAIYFLCNDVDVFLERTGLVQHNQELRGYKLIGHCRLTDEIKGLFSKRMHIWDIETEIKRAMKNER